MHLGNIHIRANCSSLADKPNFTTSNPNYSTCPSFATRTVPSFQSDPSNCPSASTEMKMGWNSIQLTIPDDPNRLQLTTPVEFWRTRRHLSNTDVSKRDNQLPQLPSLSRLNHYPIAVVPELAAISQTRIGNFLNCCHNIWGFGFWLGRLPCCGYPLQWTINALCAFHDLSFLLIIMHLTLGHGCSARLPQPICRV